MKQLAGRHNTVFFIKTVLIKPILPNIFICSIFTFQVHLDIFPLYCTKQRRFYFKSYFTMLYCPHSVPYSTLVTASVAVAATGPY